MAQPAAGSAPPPPAAPADPAGASESDDAPEREDSGEASGAEGTDGRAAAASPQETSPGQPLAESLTGEAKAEYEAGKVLYLDGDFAGASHKFGAAYEESKDHRLLWNMVAAQKNLRNYAEAINLLDRYLAEGGEKLSTEDREEALALREVMTPFVGELTIQVNEPGAAVYLDGQQVGTTPLAQSLRLNMGVREIRVEKPGFEPFATQENIRGGSDAALEVTLQKKATQGTLVVYAGASDEIRIDGEVVGTGTFTGQLPAGPHHIVVTAPGKVPYESDVLVEVGQRSTVRVKLDSQARTASPMLDQDSGGGGMPGWAWAVLGAGVAAGAGVGIYFAVRDDGGGNNDGVEGTIPPGTVQLPALIRY